VTTPPQDPFGTPRDGEDARSGTPWDQPAREQSPASGQDGQPSYGQPQPGQYSAQPSYGQPQPGQYSGQPSYGQPSYGQPQVWHGPAQTESKAIIALVCAIASWVVFPLLPAIAAIMIGKTARREIAASGGRLSGDGLVTASNVIAWANVVVSVLVVIGIVLAIVLFAAAPFAVLGVS